MKKNFILLALAFGMIACGKNNKQDAKGQAQTATMDTVANEEVAVVDNQIVPEGTPIVTPPGKAYTSSTGKLFFVDEQHPMGQMMSTININTQNFPNNFNYVMSDVDPISDVFFADLNNDGYQEFYVATQNAGSGGYGGLYGFASNKDQSVSLINTAATAGNDSGNLKNYMGKDSFAVQNGKLVRTYPMYNEGDPNCCPTGGNCVITYKLKAGEAGYSLVIENVTTK